MANKITKATVKKTINTAVGTTKIVAKQTNEFALNTTEEVVLGTISVAEQWQKVTDKALKGGLKLMANQQDLMFNTLEMVKGQLTQNRKRFTKLFA
jgi:hypothetical protein